MHRSLPMIAMLAAVGSFGPGGDVVRVESRDAVKRERSSGPPAWRTSSAHMSAGERGDEPQERPSRPARSRKAGQSVSWLGLLNFGLLQWFGVRLARVYQRAGRCEHYSPLHPQYVESKGDQLVPVGWKLLRWVWPLTGWWSGYLWIARAARG